MRENDLCYIDACEAIELFKGRKLSPVEILEAQIARAEEVEPKVNAFSSVRYEQALEQAVQIEKYYMKGTTSRLGPLSGIPIALKNEHSMIGDNTTMGSLLLKDNIDVENAPITQLLLDAGAVVHAKTNVPEFCAAGFTRSRLHGVTVTPWNLEKSSGGSSGGSAVSLACGTSTLATGSDIGGSIRIPASFNGVVGLKPSYGRVAEAAPLDASNPYNHVGPLARSVRDCALLFDVINGPHPSDITTLRPKLDVPTTFSDIRGTRIALSMNLGYFDVDLVVQKNTQRAAEALRELGAVVEEVDLPWNDRTKEAAGNNLVYMMGGGLGRLVSDDEELLNDYVLEMISKSATLTQENYFSSIKVAAEMYTALGRVFEQYDALICPTMAVPSIPAEGEKPYLESLLTDSMTYPFNMLSRCPVLSIPTGFSGDNVPTGLQIVGQTFQDLDVLKIGANLERILDWCSGHRPLQKSTYGE
jgi:Asp-tRNA(Asn)/Glu-tRNA(Gln) amidotransferase A subunit family amidase